MSQKAWWIASAVLTLAAFGGGVGVGFLGRSKGGPPGPAPQRPDPGKAEANPKPPPAPDGVRLERLKDAEALLDSAGQPVVMLKFSGNRYVEFWAEVETNGEVRYGKVSQVTSRPFAGFAGAIAHDSGDFLWLRLRTDTPGKEVWRTSLRGKNGVCWDNIEVYLFGRPGEPTIKSARELPPAPVRETPEPLPLDQPVCLKEARVISDQGDRVQGASSAGLLGSAALAHPLATTALLLAPKAEGICTIRLMCRAESGSAVPGK